MLLPEGTGAVTSVTDDETALSVALSRVESSTYADFAVPLPGPRTVRVRY